MLFKIGYYLSIIRAAFKKIQWAYELKLGLQAYCTNVEAQKMDSTFKIFGIVLASFQTEDKLRRARFFQETFLLADINVEVVL